MTQKANNKKALPGSWQGFLYRAVFCANINLEAPLQSIPFSLQKQNHSNESAV